MSCLKAERRRGAVTLPGVLSQAASFSVYNHQVLILQNQEFKSNMSKEKAKHLVDCVSCIYLSSSERGCHLLCTNCVPGPVMSPLYSVSHLILKIVWGGK